MLNIRRGFSGRNVGGRVACHHVPGKGSLFHPQENRHFVEVFLKFKFVKT